MRRQEEVRVLKEEVTRWINSLIATQLVTATLYRLSKGFIAIMMISNLWWSQVG
jgi:hypothetical protein